MLSEGEVLMYLDLFLTPQGSQEDRGLPRGAGYWTVLDQAEVSPDSKPSAKRPKSRMNTSKDAFKSP